MQPQNAFHLLTQVGLIEVRSLNVAADCGDNEKFVPQVGRVTLKYT